MDDLPKEAETPTAATTGTLYSVFVISKEQKGAYSKKENAEAQQKALKAAGFDAVTTTA